MYIKRDYSQPFFSTRRRRRVGGRFLFLYGLFIGGLLVFVSAQFSRLQLMALDVVGMAPTATPFASTWAERGYDLYSRGKLLDAVTAFGQAVSQQPNNVNYLYEYGRMLIELDRDANPAQGRSISDAELARDLGDHAISIAPNDPRGYALKAKALIWLSDSKTAIPVALQGIDTDPGFVPLYSALAIAYGDIGRYQQGVDYGEQAVAKDPMDADARRSYAISLSWVGRFDEAIQQLEDAININPNVITPYFELAGLYNYQNRTEEAVATYDTILKLDPRNAKAMLRLCEVYFKVGEGQQAEGYCRDALDVDPNFAEAYRQLGMVNYSRRNYEGAIENFAKCADMGSDEIQCYYLRGLAHFYLADGQNEHCDLAWANLIDSQERVQALPDNDNIVADIQHGLQLTADRCPQFTGLAVPTVPPEPTALPTPIGLVTGG
jgi:tetratricopeptide (TPR) repeat protein